MALTLCLVFDLIALATGAALLLRLPIGGRRRELALLAALTLAASGGALLLLWPLGGFAQLRGLAHALFCVAAPLAALRAIRIWPRDRALAGSVLATAFAAELLYLHARRIEPFRLEVTTARLDSPRLAALASPLTVACVADLQVEEIGDFERRVFDQIVALDPDLILFLGDYVQLPREQANETLAALREQLRRLQPPLGMFAVDGDVDEPLGGAAAVFAGTAVRVLVDERCPLDGAPIDIHGLSRHRSRAPWLDAGVVRRLGGERFPIIFGHAPDFMLSVVRGGLVADALCVAGHTHGGQVQVPLFGPLLLLSSVPRWLGGGGVFRHGSTWLAVSRGLGMERGAAPRIRFWCRPQLLVLELGAGRAPPDGGR